jgi:agmatinase
VATFNRLPYVPDLKGKHVDVAILGVPFDGGTTYRPGSRFAPRAVRDASVLCRNFNPVLGVPVYEKLNVVDGGDISTNPLNLQTTFKNIEKHVREAHLSGARTICVGGDHSILLPELRAVHAKYGKPIIVQFDAHTDTADGAWGEKYHHGTPIRRAIEEGLISGSDVFQIGIRGPLTSADQEDYCREQKINILDIDSFYDIKRREQFFNSIHNKAKPKAKGKQRPVFVSFDVDGVDPAFAPGTGTPVVGGMTSFEALQCVRKLHGLNICGADVVEISPPYDHSELTSLLGAALVFEFLSLMAN